MKDQKKNEELQSRRDFFRNAAKAALPILGAVFLANNSMLAKAMEKSAEYCSHCNSNCTNGCRTACHRGCGNNCYVGCEGYTRSHGGYGCETCRSACMGCQSQCSGTCSGSCMRSAYTVS